MHKFTALLNRRSIWLIGGLLLGALAVLAIRFATYSPAYTHYHANFAVYLNGKREEFKDPSYYQSVSACQINGPIQPEQRAHMHSNINSVVHVHDDGVTWGDFFMNLGWYVGPDFVQTKDGTLYKANGNQQLHVLLNGNDLTGGAAISRQIIGDRDRLLISFGDEDAAALQQQFRTVPSTAHHYDISKDPASCGSNAPVTTKDRFDNLF